MTNETERIELLKAVADCAPEWMRATFSHGNVSLNGCEYTPYCRANHPDEANGDFIIALLDAMEKEGWHVDLMNVPPVMAEPVGCRYYCNGRQNGGDNKQFSTPLRETRAEAVARAFVAVFGGKE